LRGGKENEKRETNGKGSGVDGRAETKLTIYVVVLDGASTQ
jgi:hypothetical protein